MSGEEREGDDERAVEASVLGRPGSGRQLAAAESFELLSRVEDDGEIVGVVQQVALERVVQRGELLVEQGEMRLRLVVEGGAGVGHLAVVALDEVALLGVEVEPVESVVHLLHPLVQRAIQGDRVPVRGHQRGELFVDRLDLVRRVGGAHRVEGVRDAIQQLPGAFQGLDGVVERGR